VHPAHILAHRNRPSGERTAAAIAVEPFEDDLPTFLQQVLGVVVVTRVGTNRHPNP